MIQAKMAVSACLCGGSHFYNPLRCFCHKSPSLLRPPSFPENVKALSYIFVDRFL